MKYGTIVVDPPWPYPAGAFKRPTRTGFGQHRASPTFAGQGKPVPRVMPYALMSLAQIESLEVAQLADSRGCRLFLWATNPFLPAALVAMSTWGFTYRQALVWSKRGCSPLAASVAPNSAEFLIVGTIGTPRRSGTLGSAVIEHAVLKRGHSIKPDLFMALIEQVSPGPYVELFARPPHRLGWDVWGNESANTAELVTA